MDYVEPSTSSAAAEPAPTGSKEGQETPFGLRDMLNSSSRPREDKVEGENEQAIEEAPKKSSSLRFRKKPKQRRSKGLWLHSFMNSGCIQNCFAWALFFVHGSHVDDLTESGSFGSSKQV